MVEFEANPKTQFEENFKQTANNQISYFLNVFATVVIVNLLQSLISGKTAYSTWLYTQAILGVGAFILAQFISHRKAKQLIKDRYVLKDAILLAQGTGGRRDWQLPISQILRAKLFTDKNQREKLIVSSNQGTFSLSGLEHARTLLQSLPEGVQADECDIYNKLLSAAQSVHESKDAGKIEVQRNSEKSRELIAQQLDGVANVFILKPDFSIYKLALSLTLCFLIPLLTGTFIGYAEYCLPCLAVIVFRGLRELIPFLRTSKCIYVFSPDAVFEVNCSKAEVNTLTLNRVSVLAHENSEASLAVDGRRLPAKISSDSLASVYSALKNYPKG